MTKKVICESKWKLRQLVERKEQGNNSLVLHAYSDCNADIKIL